MYYGEKYILNDNSRIIIYGAATTGAILYHNLCNEEYRVIAFIDMRAEEIGSYYGLPVLSFAEAEKCFEQDDNIVVIVGVKNVFEHEKIARMLWEMKCNKIIFRPYNEVQGTGNACDKELNEIYDEALSGKLSYCYIIDGFEELILKDNAVICEDSKYVIANIPSQYVFTDNYKNIIWGDIPCLGLIPHIGLFNLFLGNENQDYKEYIHFCREAALRSGGIVTTKAWEDSVYSNRLDVFNHMQYAWEHDRSFFIKNAVEAQYNDKGYFNIKSGKHRIVFQLIKGAHYIPLKIEKSGYYKWKNETRAIKIKELLKETKKASLPVIIGNPYYYNYSCNSSEFYKKVLDKLIFMIFKEQYYKKRKFSFEKEKILFYNTPLAMYADIFTMLGFKVFLYEEDDDNRKLIDEIVGRNGVFIEQVQADNYSWAVIEGTGLEVKVNAEKIVRIADEGKESGQVLAVGFVNGEFVSAFMEKSI